MVSVELAIGFVTIATLLCTLVGIVLLGVTQAGLQRTSTDIARHLARGDQTVAKRIEEQAPKGSEVKVVRDHDGVAVTVAAAVPVPGLGRIPLSGSSRAKWEPGAGP